MTPRRFLAWFPSDRLARNHQPAHHVRQDSESGWTRVSAVSAMAVVRVSLPQFPPVALVFFPVRARRRQDRATLQIADQLRHGGIVRVELMIGHQQEGPRPESIPAGDRAVRPGRAGRLDPLGRTRTGKTPAGLTARPGINGRPDEVRADEIQRPVNHGLIDLETGVARFNQASTA